MAATDELTPAEFAKLRSLPPAEAVEWMRARGRLTPTFSWQDLWESEHAEQFTVSRLARMDLLQALRDGITQSVAGDLSRRDWTRNAEKLLADAGWWGIKAVTDPATGEVVLTKFDPARLKLIFDTNTRQAYAAGQWERILRTRQALPYLRYITKRDDRVRPLHALWDNVTLPVDDPFWQTHYPPNGWRCRCRVVSVSQREYDSGKTPGGGPMNKARPQVLTTEFVNRRTGEVSRVPAGIDPGFAFNPGAARKAALDKLVADKLAAVAPDLAQAAQLAGLTPKTAEGAMRGMVAESATRASAWTHPRTGETRIYINTLPGQGSAKVWVEALPRPDAFGLDYTIRVKGERLSRGEAGNLANDAERWLEQLAGGRVKKLADLLVVLGL